MREAQRRLQFFIPKSGAVNTIDTVFPYERYNQHPANKEPVGQRFAWLALKHAYGFTDIAADSSSYEYSVVKENKIWCYFTLPEMGISPYTDISGLEIANESAVFVPAIGEVSVDENLRLVLIVSSPQVAKPVAVRYCFRDFQIGNLVNKMNLPMFAFRTDNWSLPRPLPRDFWEEKFAKWNEMTIPYPR
jgi:sialate O-acetylesterase